MTTLLSFFFCLVVVTPLQPPTGSIVLNTIAICFANTYSNYCICVHFVLLDLIAQTLFQSVVCYLLNVF